MPDKLKPCTLPSKPPVTHVQNLCISVLHVLPVTQQETPWSQSTWAPALELLSHQYGSTRGSLPFSLSFCHSAHTPTSQPHGNIAQPVVSLHMVLFLLQQTYPEETVALSKRPSNNEIPENQSAQFWQHSKLPRALLSLSLSLCWGGNSINLHFRWTSETSIVLPPSWCLRDTPRYLSFQSTLIVG